MTDECTLIIDLSVPVTTNTRTTTYPDGKENNREYRVTRVNRQQSELKVVRRFEGVESVASHLVDLLTDPRPYLRQTLLDDVTLDDNESASLKSPEAGVYVNLRGSDCLESVYLVARKIAAEKTRENMIRKGYAVEDSLRWMANGSLRAMDGEKAPEIRFENLHRLAKQTMQTYTDQRIPGGDIDRAAVPDVERGYDPEDREMLHPDH